MITECSSSVYCLGRASIVDLNTIYIPWLGHQLCESSIGDVVVDLDKSTIRLSKIFKWYSMDFGSQKELMTWLLDYVNDDAAEALKKLLKSQSAITLKYNDYDWGQNSA